jgi:hypothetical protein
MGGLREEGVVTCPAYHRSGCHRNVTAAAVYRLRHGQSITPAQYSAHQMMTG